MSLAQAENGQRSIRPSAAFGARGIEVRQYDELVRFAQTVSESGLAPKGMEKPQAIFVAIQMGLELGLSPMASLQNVAVVNGRPTLWGDAQLAVCRGTGEMELFEEWYECGGQKSPRNPTKYDDDTAAVCRVKRTGGQVIESAFSVADAKRAGLWGKAGPWTQYPFRMLRNRARSFALRDGFGDALRGFRSAEDAMDMPEERMVSGREVPAAEVPRLFSGAAESQSEGATVAEAAAEPATSRRKRTPADGAKAPGTKAAEKAAAPEKGLEPPAEPFVLSDEPPPEPKEEFWQRVKAAGMDEVQVMVLLKRNGMTEAEFPADVSNEDVAFIMPLWGKLVESYQKTGGAK